MDKFFKRVKVIQERIVKGSLKCFDRKEERLNPYNPLSYVFLVLGVIACFTMHGVVGVHRELRKNPFRWR